ncbi:MAG: hypothetical protein J2P53_06560 [Bradyrhizobiaceae bacterium]|nr:hypothetical protein [Bradyrhizobiaceae bacterium]
MPDLVDPAMVWITRSALWTGIGVLAVSAIVLWAYYGGAVFFETIAAGLAACF